eukprot:Em0621g1a
MNAHTRAQYVSRRDNWNKLKNLCSKEIGTKMKNKEPQGDDDQVPASISEKLDALTAEDLKGLTVKQIKSVAVLIEEAAKRVAQMKTGLKKTFGESGVRKKYSHIDLIHMIDGVETEKGAVVAGNRCYYLKVIGKSSEVATESEVEEKYLIATSEQPLCALHRDEWMDPKDLPKIHWVFDLLSAGGWLSWPDTRGIFRVHQFEKVEQFCITSPREEESWKMQDAMMVNAEKFYQTLGIPYRVVNIVSGELNNAAARKLDLEGYFPGSGAFRE